jgi:8-oxo-dGTP pyrophosphatase MutT (NUDIX family)
VEIFPIETLPEIVQVAAPPLHADAEAAVMQRRRFISERPALWDGPVWWVLDVAPERVCVFEASYAWVLAGDEICEHDPSLGFGNMSVELVLRRDGNMLWQRRASHLTDGGGTWTYSASGGVAPGDDPTEQIRNEAFEELGLPAEALSDLRPVAVGRGRTFCPLFFTATLAEGFSPQVSEESEAFVWAPSPRMLAPTFVAVRETWRLLEPLL